MAVLKIYNDIVTEEDKQFMKWCMGIDGVCFKDIDEFLSSMDEKDNIIDLRLHCDGGSCKEGWAIYDKLRASGKDISATAEGSVASMATIIMMAAPKEKRYAYQSANICVHNPWVEGGALGESLNADDLQKAATNLQEQQDKILDLYVERCGCDREEMQALMDEDKYIDVNKAKEYGIISTIIPPASAKKKGNLINNKKTSMSKKDGKEEVKAKKSVVDYLLAKCGYKKIEDVVVAMDLSTADGSTLTVEREDGEPQVGDAASPDGEHVMPDGSTIVVKDGAITEITPPEDDKAGGDGDGAGGDGSADQKKIDELTQENEQLKQENEDLKQQLDDAKTKAKSSNDLKILNAVAMAGGEKFLAKYCSTYKPKGRNVNVTSHKTTEQVQDRADETPLEKEIRERREGTFNKKK
jgi:ATP-dependent Clp protease protease subunit